MRIATTLAISLLVSCGVSVHIREAVIYASPGSQGSVEYTIRVSVGKDDWRQIVNNEVYVYIHLVDCENHAVLFSVYPRLNGISSGDFRAMEAFLDESQGDAVSIQGTFGGPINASRRYCARLNGGSYMGPQVNTDVVPVSVELR